MDLMLLFYRSVPVVLSALHYYMGSPRENSGPPAVMRSYLCRRDSHGGWWRGLYLNLRGGTILFANIAVTPRERSSSDQVQVLHGSVE